jgi:hypothetical protein
LNNNSECLSLVISYTSYNKKKVEDFFYNNPSLPYKPLPPHSLEQSPCYPVIGMNHKRRMYYCKLHPKESENVHLESIEHHCKYNEPEVHKLEILRARSLIDNHDETTVRKTEDKKKIIAQFIEENKLDDAYDKMLSGI